MLSLYITNVVFVLTQFPHQVQLMLSCFYFLLAKSFTLYSYLETPSLLKPSFNSLEVFAITKTKGCSLHIWQVKQVVWVG